jgi:hypothetical protein
MSALLPSSNPNDSKAEDGDRHGTDQASPIPDINKILSMLVRLNGLIMLKIVTPQQASLIQRSLRIVLDVHLKRAREDRLGMPHEGVLEAVRKDPSLVNLLAPFLTDDQVAQVMQGVTEEESDDET